MSFMEKIKQIVNVDEDNYYDNDAVEEDYEEYDDYDTGREEAEEEPARPVHEPRAEANPNRVVRISNASSQLQVVLVKPDRFDDVTGIADHVNGKRTVVLNLESANRETSPPPARFPQRRSICERRLDQSSGEQYVYYRPLQCRFYRRFSR